MLRQIAVRFAPDHATLFRKLCYVVVHHHVPLRVQFIALQPQLETRRAALAAEADHEVDV